MYRRIMPLLLALLFLLAACQAPAGVPAGLFDDELSSKLPDPPSSQADEPEHVQFYMTDPRDPSRYVQIDPAELGQGRRCWVADPENGASYTEVVLTGQGEDGEYVFVSYTGPNLTQERLDAVLDEVMEDHPATAVSVAVIEDGEVTVSGAWGWAVKDRREMTADTKIRAASLSKVAVGMCAMAMAEDGVLELDAPLSAYWGEGIRNPYTTAQPSTLTLMTHTSSITDQEITGGLYRLQSILQDPSSWRKMEPGDGLCWYYNNFGFCVLGTTLELAVGGTLDQYLRSRYLEPLGIRAALFSGELAADEMADLYGELGLLELSASTQAAWPVPTQPGEGAAYFPGNLTISAPDLARLVAVLIGDGSYHGVRCLSAQSVADMETPRFTVDFPGNPWPFDQCLVLRHQEDLMGRASVYYHTGSAYGLYSLLSYDPEAGDGVVVLTTGAPYQVNKRGLYTLCADLSGRLYAEMEGNQS